MLNETLKTWFPLIAFVLIIGFFGTIRCNRIFKTHRMAKAQFMKTCTKTKEKQACTDTIDRNHEECFDMTTSLQRAGVRSSRFTIDLKLYNECMADLATFKVKRMKKTIKRAIQAR